MPSGPDPELFTQDPAGKILYVANENDNTVTIIDMEKRARLGEVQVGVEPEGMGLSPDGKILVNTSETTNMAHFIDTQTREIVANVLVDARPRFAEFKPDGSELWVSAEIGGTVSVIDPAKHAVKKKITFDIPGLRKEAIQPVGISITRDGKTGFVALGPANRVAVIDGATHEVTEISARRSARLAHGVHAGRKVSADHQRRIERRFGHRRRQPQGHQDDPGRRVALGRRHLAAMTLAQMHGRRDSRAVAVEGVSHSLWRAPRARRRDLRGCAGDFAVLLGLNGAGKSTLFSLITRLYAAQRGRIRIFGHDVARASGAGVAPARRRVPAAHARSRSLGHAEPDLPCRAARHRRARRPRARRRSAGAHRAGATARTTRCATFPAGRCAASRSPARCCTGRACCCSTSRRSGLDIKARADILGHVRGLVAARWRRRCCGRRI